MKRLLSFKTLTVGLNQMCGLDGAGAAWCWGRGALPAHVETPVRFAALSAGDRATCGTDPAGGVFCWGKFHPLTSSDRLRHDDTGIHRVARGEQFSDVVSGGDYACGITLDERLLCW
jgi:hypothetical protein